NDHTTHLAGTLIGQGLNLAARGMAFGAHLSVWNFDNDIPEMATAAKDLLLSNHAYGPVVGWALNPDRPGTDINQKWEWWGNPVISPSEDYQFGFYTTKASDIDRIQYSNPYYLVVRSADNKHAETGPPANTSYYIRNTSEKSTLLRSRNDGYDVIASEATAKNVLTVGAADIVGGGEQVNRISVSAYSGWGPTDDGRIKPDLLGVGLPMLSTLSSGTAAYGNLMGTSMASANVTGSLLLLQELYSRFQPDKFMRAATLRALVLHTATRIKSPAVQELVPPDYKQGWGLLNLSAAAQVLLNDNGAHALQELTLRQDAVYTFQVVAQGNEPLVVTICWTDPEATPTSVSTRFVNSRVPKLVNDLDLRLLDGTETASPWVLNPNRPEQAATTGDNIRDNVEQVVIQKPVPGQSYTIRVSHKGELRYGAQPFSIMVSGLKRASCKLAVSLLPTPDTTLCAGKSTALTAGAIQAVASGALATDVTYSWLFNGDPLSGATGSVYTASQPGFYSLRVTDKNGCVGKSATVELKGLSESPAVTPSTGQLLCAARPSVRLSVSPEAGATYEWLRDGRTVANGPLTTFIASTPGQYSIRLTRQGCQSSSLPITIELATEPASDIIPADSEILIPNGSSVRLQINPNPSYQYQWLRNEQTLPNATISRWLVNQPGQYRVRIVQQGCTALSSVRTVRWADDSKATTLPDSILQNRPADSNLLVMPNPAFDQVEVLYFRPVTNTPYATLYNASGAAISNPISLVMKAGVLQFSLPVQDLPHGHYFIQVVDGPRIRRARLVKR
ncbi:MAG: S8 family serine peptidase, partial [Rudanella sp.]|nr:S8 family serine peptidase [Rudanella sp.]